jgi:hypothetical protein
VHGEIDQPETTALAAANDAPQPAAPRADASWAAAAPVPVMWEFAPPPAEPVALIDPMALDAAHAQISALEARLERSEEENRAFIQTLRHVASAAEELLTEARHDAATLRGAAEHEVVSMRTEMEQRLALAVGEAHREATRVLDEAHATAHELVVVARADAREIVHEERRAAASDLEMLAAVRERIAEERESLTRFHDQLSGRLRGLVEAMLDFADSGTTLEAGDAQFAATVLTGPQGTRAIEQAGYAEYHTEPAAPTPSSADAVLTSSSGDPVLTSSSDDPVVKSSSGDPVLTPSSGDPVVKSSSGDPVLTPSSDTAVPVTEPSAETAPVSAPSDESAPVTESTVERAPGNLHSADEHLDRAFDAFFSEDIDDEPSRRWILED